MSLDKKICLLHGVIMHELMHALGFWHEHARHDRDDHVKIHHHNVKSGHQFTMQCSDVANEQS